MSFAIISDIHVKHNRDENYSLLMRFLRDPRVRTTANIVLLGDIFDLMVGPHKEYFELYNDFFHELNLITNNGTNVHYFEGNHDFHLEKLLATWIEINGVDENRLHLHKEGKEFRYNNQKIYFSHGDDIEIGNPSYKRYKKFITSKPLNLIANYVLPYDILDKLGGEASAKSRENNKKYYLDQKFKDSLKASFREAARLKWVAGKYDVIVCGHSHVKDDFESKQGYRYINNGFAAESATFILIDQDGPRFEDLM